MNFKVFFFKFIKLLILKFLLIIVIYVLFSFVLKVSLVVCLVINYVVIFFFNVFKFVLFGMIIFIEIESWRGFVFIFNNFVFGYLGVFKNLCFRGFYVGGFYFFFSWIYFFCWLLNVKEFILIFCFFIK